MVLYNDCPFYTSFSYVFFLTFPFAILIQTWILGIDSLVCNFKIQILGGSYFKSDVWSYTSLKPIWNVLTAYAQALCGHYFILNILFSCRHLLKKTGLPSVIHFQIAWECQLYLEVATCPLNYPGNHLLGVSHHHPCASHLDPSHPKPLLHMHKLLPTTLPYSCRCVLKWFLEIIKAACFRQL